MALIDSFPGVSLATDFDELRKLYAGTLVRDAFGVPRAGVFPIDGSPIVSGRSDLKFNVADVRFATVRNGGVMFGGNNGVAVVDPPAIGLPSANSRIDILWVKQNVSASPIGDATDGPVFGWTTGTASATPQRPSTALPAGALEIGQVQTAFNATATNDGTKVTITPSGPLTAMAGGVVPFRSASEMNDWTTAAPGQLAEIIGTAGLWSFVAGTPGYWVPLSTIVSKYSISQNVNTGTAAAVTATPAPVGGEASALSDQLFTRVPGGFNIIRAGEYEIGGPLTLHIAGTLQKLNQRIFIDVIGTGIPNQRIAVYGAPNEDGIVTPPAKLRLPAGAQLRFNFFHSNGSTVTFAWLPFLTWLGPLV